MGPYPTFSPLPVSLNPLIEKGDRKLFSVALSLIEVLTTAGSSPVGCSSLAGLSSLENKGDSSVGRLQIYRVKFGSTISY